MPYDVSNYVNCAESRRRVVWDESCRWNPRNGCNAGGQGLECRFVWIWSKYYEICVLHQNTWTQFDI